MSDEGKIGNKKINYSVNRREETYATEKKWKRTALMGNESCPNRSGDSGSNKIFSLHFESPTTAVLKFFVKNRIYRKLSPSYKSQLNPKNVNTPKNY